MTVLSRPPVLLLVLLLAAVGFVLERLIVTDGEALESWADATAAAAEAWDRETLETLLGPSFEYERRDREHALDYVQSVRERVKPKGIRIRLSKVEIDGDEATARARIDATAYGRPNRFEMRFRWVRSDAGWSLVSAEHVY